MRDDDLQEMRQLRLFEGVGAAYVEALLRSAFVQRFPTHVELVHEGDPADFLYVIVQGQVEIYASYRDRETTISVLGPGNSFIIAAVLLDRVYLKSARGLTPTRILMLPAEAVRESFAQDAHFARALAVDMALAYRAVVKELKNQKLRSSLERLANWLIAEDERQGRSGQLEIPYDKKVLASRLGMAPEVLSRSIAALIPYNVDIRGRQVRLNDRNALLSLARPVPTIDDPAC
ncbi:MAG: cyclic nucleotide-binding domain-containing protein [Beijerinckiaceae bacterium]|nr:cyclic nucleotide-binding domain-containing protein [Beijerinckiaceae bacterium]